MDNLARTQPETAAMPEPALRAGPIIAEFACPRHAKLFAGLLREAGEQVTITPGINHILAVRTLVRSL